MRCPAEPASVKPVCLRELEAVAKARLAPPVYDFFAGGAEDERTLADNEAAFARLTLLPRVLSGGMPDTALSRQLLGTRFGTPLFLAPTAFHGLAHADGELATARAAAATQTPMIVSMAATTAVEDIAAAAGANRGALWFQTYIQSDRGFMRDLLGRAEDAGCQALVVTVDSPVFGRRERDERHHFHDLPAGLSCRNMRDRTGQTRSIEFTPRAAWADVAWIVSQTRLPVVLKGILHPADALSALEHGARGLIVSNHGGRQLDSAVAAIDALPAVAAAVRGRLPLLLDGGVRRGTDVVKALALGAAAVGIGRPVIWGLASGGEQGVRTVIELLQAELIRALALCGVTSLDAVDPDLIHNRLAR